MSVTELLVRANRNRDDAVKALNSVARELLAATTSFTSRSVVKLLAADGDGIVRLAAGLLDARAALAQADADLDAARRQVQ